MKRGTFILRVRAPKLPESEAERDYRLRSGSKCVRLMASWPDIELSVVTDDGEEINVPDVKSIAFRFAEDDHEALVVSLELRPQELQIELRDVALSIAGGA